MRLRINSATATQFKGFANKSFTFDSDKIKVSGRNGSGKSTLGIMTVLPFTMKDLIGHANPEIRPDNLAESEPHITLDCSVDGKPVSIELIQKDTRTAKEREENLPPKIANKFAVNSVPMSATKFKSDLASRGIDLAKYESLTSTSYFDSLKEVDKRSVVFGLAGEITDMDVCDAIGSDVQDVRTQLENYSLEEVTQIASAAKKTATARLNALPEQIIGATKSLVDVPVADLNKKKSELEARRKELEEDLASIPEKSVSDIRIEIHKTEVKKREIVNEANKAKTDAVTASQSALSDAQNKYKCQSLVTNNLEAKLELVSDKLRELRLKKSSAEDEIKKAEAKVFPDNATRCPKCGQELPKDKLDEMRATFTKNKEAFIAGLVSGKSDLDKEVHSLSVKMQDLTNEITASRERESEYSKAYEEALTALERAKQIPEADGMNNPEFYATEQEIVSLNNSIREVEEMNAKRSEIKSSIGIIDQELIHIENELAKETVNQHTRELISNLQAEQKKVSQSIADCEKILYQVGLVNRKKNELLSDQINSHFADFIKFKLYDYQKNGEIKDCCVPMIRNEQGEWKDYRTTANNSLRLKADIAILDGLQTFYNLHLPIVVENAECLDENSLSQIQADTQLIFLVVSEEPELTVQSI